MTQQIGQYTHHISDHVHFFHPRCGDACVCSANALEEFTESELRTVPQGLSLSLPPLRTPSLHAHTHIGYIIAVYPLCDFPVLTIILTFNF